MKCKFDFWDGRYKVTSWKDFAERILFLLNDLDSALLSEIAQSVSNKKLSLIEKNLRKPSKIAENIYFETNLSSSGMVSFIRDILQKYEILESDITVYLK